MGKWSKGIIILAIASLILGWLFGMPKIKSMENDISASLKSAGYDFANVEMSGNVAKLTGNAPTEAFARDAVGVAENTKCSKCKGKRTWHVVRNDMTVEKAPALPTQSPYVFDGVKDANGNIVLSGYVASEEARDSIMSKARSIFSGNVTNKTIKIAAGAPNANWNTAIESNMNELNRLNTGRFAMSNITNFITGEAESVEIRDSVVAAGTRMPAGYEFQADVTIPATAPVENTDLNACQAIFDNFSTGQSIEFATDKAEIRGSQSFDLLNSVAAAAKQCRSFRITVGGHTDSIGSDEYNQWLSEARANTVVAYLNQNEVEISRLTAVGFGESTPRSTNDTPEGRALNRRIEFTLTQSE